LAVGTPMRINDKTYLFLLPVALLSAGGCSLLRSTPRIDERVGLIAVMPIERATPERAGSAEDGPALEPGAERVVTAQIYRVLSSSSQWRFVPDLTVAQAMSKIGSTGDQAARARALGKAVGADAVLFGTVFRYSERVGGEYGAKEPAAVGFALQLVSVSSDKILWKGSFEQTQEPLSANLFNWWQFWKGGPKWFSAQEFTHIAADKLLGDLAARLGT
jgi:hypothetical protein